MADEQGNQTLRVQPGTGATTGAALDAGTDREQTNRRPSDDTVQDGERETSTNVDVGALAGGTAIDSGEPEDADSESSADYGAGDPENFAGGTTSGGAGSSTGRGADVGQGTTKAETDPMSSGAANTKEVTGTGGSKNRES